MLFTLLVPSTPHGIAWAADMHGGGDEAEEHRQAFVEELREEGLNVGDARVGDPDPLAAIQDECNFNDYDELIVSTLPLHISKWLKVDLPRKAQAATGLPVKHVVGSSPDGPRGAHGRRPRDRAYLRGVRGEADAVRDPGILDTGGPFLCTVHANEEVALDEDV